MGKIPDAEIDAALDKLHVHHDIQDRLFDLGTFIAHRVDTQTAKYTMMKVNSVKAMVETLSRSLLAMNGQDSDDAQGIYELILRLKNDRDLYKGKVERRSKLANLTNQNVYRELAHLKAYVATLQSKAGNAAPGRFEVPDTYNFMDVIHLMDEDDSVSGKEHFQARNEWLRGEYEIMRRKMQAWYEMLLKEARMKIIQLQEEHRMEIVDVISQRDQAVRNMTLRLQQVESAYAQLEAEFYCTKAQLDAKTTTCETLLQENKQLQMSVQLSREVSGPPSPSTTTYSAGDRSVDPFGSRSHYGSSQCIRKSISRAAALLHVAAEGARTPSDVGDQSRRSYMENPTSHRSMDSGGGSQMSAHISNHFSPSRRQSHISSVLMSNSPLGSPMHSSRGQSTLGGNSNAAAMQKLLGDNRILIEQLKMDVSELLKKDRERGQTLASMRRDITRFKNLTGSIVQEMKSEPTSFFNVGGPSERVKIKKEMAASPSLAKRVYQFGAIMGVDSMVSNAALQQEYYKKESLRISCETLQKAYDTLRKKLMEKGDNDPTGSHQNSPFHSPREKGSNRNTPSTEQVGSPRTFGQLAKKIMLLETDLELQKALNAEQEQHFNKVWMKQSTEQMLGLKSSIDKLNLHCIKEDAEAQCDFEPETQEIIFLQTGSDSCQNSKGGINAGKRFTARAIQTDAIRMIPVGRSFSIDDGNSLPPQLHTDEKRRSSFSTRTSDVGGGQSMLNSEARAKKEQALFLREKMLVLREKALKAHTEAEVVLNYGFETDAEGAPGDLNLPPVPTLKETSYVREKIGKNKQNFWAELHEGDVDEEIDTEVPDEAFDENLSEEVQKDKVRGILKRKGWNLRHLAHIERQESVILNQRAILQKMHIVIKSVAEQNAMYKQESKMLSREVTELEEEQELLMKQIEDCEETIQRLRKLRQLDRTRMNALSTVESDSEKSESEDEEVEVSARDVAVGRDNPPLEKRPSIIDIMHAIPMGAVEDEEPYEETDTDGDTDTASTLSSSAAASSFSRLSSRSALSEALPREASTEQLEVPVVQEPIARTPRKRRYCPMLKAAVALQAVLLPMTTANKWMDLDGGKKEKKGKRKKKPNPEDSVYIPGVGTLRSNKKTPVLKFLKSYQPSWKIGNDIKSYSSSEWKPEKVEGTQETQASVLFSDADEDPKAGSMNPIVYNMDAVDPASGEMAVSHSSHPTPLAPEEEPVKGLAHKPAPIEGVDTDGVDSVTTSDLMSRLAESQKSPRSDSNRILSRSQSALMRDALKHANKSIYPRPTKERNQCLTISQQLTQERATRIETMTGFPGAKVRKHVPTQRPPVAEVLRPDPGPVKKKPKKKLKKKKEPTIPKNIAPYMLDLYKTRDFEVPKETTLSRRESVVDSVIIKGTKSSEIVQDEGNELSRRSQMSMSERDTAQADTCLANLILSPKSSRPAMDHCPETVHLLSRGSVSPSTVNPPARMGLPTGSVLIKQQMSPRAGPREDSTSILRGPGSETTRSSASHSSKCSPALLHELEVAEEEFRSPLSVELMGARGTDIGTTVDAEGSHRETMPPDDQGSG